jgi:hypothetical protein
MPALQYRTQKFAVILGLGRMVVSEIETLNVSVNLV